MLSSLWKKLDLTSDWQVRCPSCGRTRDLQELGGYRLAPRSMGGLKRTLSWCRSCRALRLVVIEPASVHAAD